MRRVVKEAIEWFHQIDLDIRYSQTPNSNHVSPPRLFDDMMEALHYQRGGKEAAFYCPLDQSAHPVGFNFSSDGWHPFVETLKDYRNGKALTYEESILKEYYDKWRPQNACEAIVGLDDGPEELRNMPPHLSHLTPWLSDTPSEMDQSLRKTYLKDHEEYGFDNLAIEKGCKHYGPVSEVKGRLEFKRLVEVYRSIEEKGYDRRHGDVKVRIVKRDGELVFLNRGGYHRMAAMAALGYRTIPACFKNPWFIDVKDVDYWPQVRRGVWGRSEALRYVDHLFDFDSKEWAKDQGFL